MPHADGDAVEAVAELHRWLEAWIGRGDRDALEKTCAALGDGFLQVGPDGVARDRAAVVAMLDRLGAARAGGPPFAIYIRNGRVVARGPERVLVVYEEHQQGGGVPSSVRISTALLIEGNVPGGWVWQHLHETWISPPG